MGKTTLLKQWIASLITEGVPPQHITFFTGELLNDFHELIDLFIQQYTTLPHAQMQYIIVTLPMHYRSIAQKLWRIIANCFHPRCYKIGSLDCNILGLY